MSRLLRSIALGGLASSLLIVACSDDSETEGTAGQAGSSAGQAGSSAGKAGSSGGGAAGKGGAGTAGVGGTSAGTAGTSAGTAGMSAGTAGTSGAGGSTAGSAGDAGAAGATAGTAGAAGDSGAAGDAGAGGLGGTAGVGGDSGAAGIAGAAGATAGSGGSGGSAGATAGSGGTAGATAGSGGSAGAVAGSGGAAGAAAGSGGSAGATAGSGGSGGSSATPTFNVRILTTSNTILSTTTANVANVVSTPITLVPNNETLLGLDWRPKNSTLYVVSSNGTASKLYTLTDPGSVLSLTPVSLLPSPIVGTSQGIDFNPVLDVLRIVNAEDGSSYRVNPISGASIKNGTVDFAAGDPNAADKSPRVVAAAYTTSVPIPGSGASTTLYDIVDLASGNDILVTQETNSSVLTTVGSLGITVDANTSFDIVTVEDNDGKRTDYGYLLVGKSFYSVNLTSGATTLVGTVGGGNVTTRGLVVHQ